MRPWEEIKLLREERESKKKSRGIKLQCADIFLPGDKGGKQRSDKTI